ncbi:unnamed protein product [Arctia plantaginis]|uniref:Uncharacterized protein n=1 Tax=Arctia plantaginis TaxID=874455 RepID=A0A8S1AN70_ARCPL|nr:unnamed protein product [Arctia plantaginis]
MQSVIQARSSSFIIVRRSERDRQDGEQQVFASLVARSSVVPRLVALTLARELGDNIGRTGVFELSLLGAGHDHFDLVSVVRFLNSLLDMLTQRVW